MSSKSNIGRSMLEKYGWKEGKGLGRDEAGIVNPIKVNGNFNAYGLGHDVGEEFRTRNQWWDNVYNKAADNISERKSEDGTINVRRKAETQIDQNVIPYVKYSSCQYSSFVKGGELSEVAEERDMSKTLSYDEIFKLCGGRTAHKGARHGLTMSAKLARIEKQELELMAEWQSTEDQQYLCEDKSGKKKKKKSKKRNNSADSEYPDRETKKDNWDMNSEKCFEKASLQEKCADRVCDIDILKPKKSKRIKDDKEQSHSKELDTLQDETTDEIMMMPRKKKRKNRGVEEEEEDTVGTEEAPLEGGDSEKKSKNKRDQAENKKYKSSLHKSEAMEIVKHVDEALLQCDITDIIKKIKKKKRKTECDVEEVYIDSRENNMENVEHNDECVKKKKKKKNKQIQDQAEDALGLEGREESTITVQVEEIYIGSCENNMENEEHNDECVRKKKKKKNKQIQDHVEGSLVSEDREEESTTINVHRKKTKKAKR